ILVIFILIFRDKIAAYAYHLTFNLSVILMVLVLSFRRKGSLWVRTASLWYPLVLYALLYYQTGLINRVVLPRFLDGFFFQLSSLFYLCFAIFILLPVEGPIALRNEYYHQGGPFQTMVDFIWAGGENPGAAFPSSHVAATFLVAWWGSTQFKRMKIPYWLTCLFLSIATVYCMFHYAVDVMGGLFLGILAVLTFNRDYIKRADSSTDHSLSSRQK